MARITILGNEDEDPAQHFDGHEDAGEMLDPPIDGAETDEMMKAKQKELEASYDTLGAGSQKGRNLCAIRRKRVSEL